MIKDKTKLIQDINDIKKKLSSMEKELSINYIYKHFPSEGDEYYVLCSDGATLKLIADSDELLVNTYKTKQEAHRAYDKSVALEKVKRKLIELQGEWKPNWTNSSQCKAFILYDNYDCNFKSEIMYCNQYDFSIPYMKSLSIAETIINEMQSELKVIFDVNLK